MHQYKITSNIQKDILFKIKKGVREVNFHIATTIILCLLMSFFVVVLGLYVNDHVKKFMSSEEQYFPEPTSFSTLSSVSSQMHIMCNSSQMVSTNGSELKDWIAPKVLWHSMSDEELMWRASMVPKYVEYPYNRTPKVAFMFLSRGRLPLSSLWEIFFRGNEGLYSIYLHLPPESTKDTPKTSPFYERAVPSKAAEWGKATIVDAERRLLANALLDFSNERFVLLSETCIPLFNFSTIYKHLMNSNNSFLSSFDDPRSIGRGRYNKNMFPTITISEWRKGSQWFEVQRKLAIEIVSDVKYYPVMREHCKPPCYMDEHYLATLVNLVGPQLTSNRSLTSADWSRGGSHPATFMREDVSEVFLNQMRHGSNCTYNGDTSSVCFLFARKFHPNTLEPLLKIASTMYS